MAIMHGLSSTRRRIVVVGLTLLALAVLGSSAACGTSPIGVDACKRIEQVRCESAQACGISLDHPVHEGDTPQANVAACIRYYDDQCLHGIAGPAEPKPQEVDACVNAIITGDCTVVKTPESDPSCHFLVPVPKTVDASVDAEAGPG
jgi:hypothetical protein